MNNHHKPAQISAEFKAELEKELVRLKMEVRPMVADRLKQAREGGDITDNAAFEQAKEDLARLTGRINEVEQTLREAKIVQHNGNGRHPRVEIGSKVTIARDDGKQSTYTIVDSVEAAAHDGKISDESPIGRALYGKKRGDKVTVKAPARTVSYTITEIH